VGTRGREQTPLGTAFPELKTARVTALTARLFDVPERRVGDTTVKTKESKALHCIYHPGGW
jgi:hypothetical protein